MQTIERTALTQLVTNEKYARKVLPFIKGDYFSDKTERTVFEEITKFVDKYISLLSSGGAKHHKDLLTPFGLDTSNPDFWDSGLSLISSMIDELEKIS